MSTEFLDNFSCDYIAGNRELASEFVWKILAVRTLRVMLALTPSATTVSSGLKVTGGGDLLTTPGPVRSRAKTIQWTIRNKLAKIN